MNSSTLIILFFTIIVCFSIYAQGYIPTDSPSCYGSSCPAGTTRCKKHMKSNADGHMAITISCLDDEDGSLKTYFYEEPSSLNSYTHYESTSYMDIENSYRGFR